MERSVKYDIVIIDEAVFIEPTFLLSWYISKPIPNYLSNRISLTQPIKLFIWNLPYWHVDRIFEVLEEPLNLFFISINEEVELKRREMEITKMLTDLRKVNHIDITIREWPTNYYVLPNCFDGGSYYPTLVRDNNGNYCE